MTDNKSDGKQERYDRSTPLIEDKIDERELQYDTGDEHRHINEPSKSYTSWTVDDTVAKAAALAQHDEDREKRKEDHERRVNAAREAQSRNEERGNRTAGKSDTAATGSSSSSSSSSSSTKSNS